MKLLEEDEIYKTLLRMEIESLKALAGSTNILQLYDTFSTKNNTYLMTEYCDTDLCKYMKEKKVLYLSEALILTEQILSGYMAINRAGYVHRDIKPANIFLKNGRCKIADFGFAVPIA
jgi:serine/threonine-protein kinase ULK/ATG1